MAGKCKCCNTHLRPDLDLCLGCATAQDEIDKLRTALQMVRDRLPDYTIASIQKYIDDVLHPI